MQYYIRQQRKYVSGPHDDAHIRQWVKEAKVREEMEFSEDGEEWMLGIEMYEFFSPEARAASRDRSHRLV